MKKRTLKKSRITQLTLIMLNIVSAASLFWKGYTQTVLLVNFISLVFLFFLNVDKTMRSIDFITFMMTLFSLIVTNLYHSAIGVTVIYLIVLLLGFLSRKIKIDSTLFSRIRIITIILLITYIISCDNAKLFYRQTTIDYFGNIVNANTLGMLAVIVYFNIELLLVDMKKRKIISLFRVLSFLFSVFYVNLCGCRIVTFSFLFYLILLFLKKKPFEKDTFQIILMVELIMCFIFPMIYVYLSTRWGDIMFMGKEMFSGREYIWQNGFELIKKYPIFGSGNDFLYGMRADDYASSHNFILGVVKMFGIIPTTSLIYMLSRCNNGWSSSIYRDRTSQFVKISILLIGFTEASFISANTCFLLMMLFMSPDDSKFIQKE